MLENAATQPILIANACHVCDPPDGYPELESEDRLHFRHYGARFGDGDRWVWINGKLDYLTIECCEGPHGWALRYVGIGCIGGGEQHLAAVIYDGMAVDVSAPDLVVR